MSKRIMSISYEPSLLRTPLFAQDVYDVTLLSP